MEIWEYAPIKFNIYWKGTLGPIIDILWRGSMSKSDFNTFIISVYAHIFLKTCVVTLLIYYLLLTN